MLNDPALETQLREAIVKNGGGRGSGARSPQNYTKELNDTAPKI